MMIMAAVDTIGGVRDPHGALCMKTSLLFLSILVLPAAVPAQGPSPAIPRRAVGLTFAGMVGDQPFACGQHYQKIGTGGAEAWATEFRFFVHGIRLVRDDGVEVAMTLAQDSLWQNGDVALVDFEDATGPCANGTPETNRTVRGTVPEGRYTGVRFLVGVPFERNHLELASQPSPLTLSRLFWSWTTGYKFIRLDMRSVHPDSAGVTLPWVLHLGSTQCTKAEDSPKATACAVGNRPEITLKGLDPDRDVIVLDVAALLAGVDLAKNMPKTAAGCMSSPDDVDCGPMFAALGLAHPAAPASGVAPAFRVGRRSTP